jgi:predicted RNA-binding protein associated with RNAse of E/G family
VTYLPRAGVDRPSVVEGRTILEADSPIVWFTFPGHWHDIGAFHTSDDAFTGWYANILTPVEIEDDTWTTTDLFVDVFVDPAGAARVLDREELADAVSRGWVDAGTAERAEHEAESLVRAARDGRWPPAIVEAWPLERVRAEVGDR